MARDRLVAWIAAAVAAAVLVLLIGASAGIAWAGVYGGVMAAAGAAVLTLRARAGWRGRAARVIVALAANAALLAAVAAAWPGGRAAGAPASVLALQMSWWRADAPAPAAVLWRQAGAAWRAGTPAQAVGPLSQLVQVAPGAAAFADLGEAEAAAGQCGGGAAPALDQAVFLGDPSPALDEAVGLCDLQASGRSLMALLAVRYLRRAAQARPGDQAFRQAALAASRLAVSAYGAGGW